MSMMRYDNTVGVPLPLDGSQVLGRTVTAATTLTNADTFVVFNSSSAITQPLPSAASVTPFKLFGVSVVGTGGLTISATVAGVSGRVLRQNSSMLFYSTGSLWMAAEIFIPPQSRTVIASTTISIADEIVIYNSAAGISQALPSSGMISGKRLTLTNINTGVVTISTSVSGTASRTLAQWASIDVYSPDSGATWLAA